jgi:hypothetical protein
MENIKVIKNFVDAQAASKLINSINLLEQTMPEEFSSYQDGKRLALQFGIDVHQLHNSHSGLTLLGEMEPLFREYCNQAVKATKDSFEVDPAAELFVCSLWLAKQYPGAVIPIHEDTESGHNDYFEYSAVLYLNALEDSGDLEFPDLGYTCRPAAGDLVIFPSKSTGMHRVSKILEDRYSMPLWLTFDRSYQL